MSLLIVSICLAHASLVKFCNEVPQAFCDSLGGNPEKLEEMLISYGPRCFNLIGSVAAAQADDSVTSDLSISVTTNNGGPRVDGQLWASPKGPSQLLGRDRRAIKVGFGNRTTT